MMNKELKGELLSIWPFAALLIVLFAGIFIYWINSSYYKDIQAQNRIKAIDYLQRAYAVNVLGINDGAIYPQWAIREKIMKKYNILEEEIIPNDIYGRNFYIPDIIKQIEAPKPNPFTDKEMTILIYSLMVIVPVILLCLVILFIKYFFPFYKFIRVKYYAQKLN